MRSALLLLLACPPARAHFPGDHRVSPLSQDWDSEGPASVDRRETLERVFGRLLTLSPMEDCVSCLGKEHGWGWTFEDCGAPAAANICAVGEHEGRLETGKYITVGEGIWSLAQACDVDGVEVPKEDVLAFILAHELAHLQNEDPLRTAEHAREACGAWFRGEGPASRRGFEAACRADSACLSRARAYQEALDLPSVAAAERERRLRALLESGMALCREEFRDSFMARSREREDLADVDAANLLSHLGYSSHAPLCAAHHLREFESGRPLGADWSARSHPAPLLRILRALQSDAVLSGQ
jgi:hypothetical protein